MGRKATPDTAVDTAIPITPLIDMTFQLLIFFMCAMKFKTLARKVFAFLPKDRGPAQYIVEFKDDVKLSVILSRGPDEPETRVRFLDSDLGEGVAAFDELTARLKRVHERSGPQGPGGFIDALAEVPHRDVMRCLDAFLKAGVTDVQFKGTAPPGR